MQSLTVKDLMVAKDKYATISADVTLRDAALALYEAQLKELSIDPARHRDRAVLAIDAHGEVYGKLALLPCWTCCGDLNRGMTGLKELVRRPGRRQELDPRGMSASRWAGTSVYGTSR